MAYSKKRLIATAMAGVLAMMSAFPGYAASRKKITSVSVSIKADIEPETDFGQEIGNRQNTDQLTHKRKNQTVKTFAYGLKQC